MPLQALTSYGPRGVTTGVAPAAPPMPGAGNTSELMGLLMGLVKKRIAERNMAAPNLALERNLQKMGAGLGVSTTGNRSYVSDPGPGAAAPGRAPVATFGTTTPHGPGIIGEGLNAWTPGMSVGGGNAPVATGYLPAGYAPFSPSSASVREDSFRPSSASDDIVRADALDAAAAPKTEADEPEWMRMFKSYGTTGQAAQRAA